MSKVRYSALLSLAAAVLLNSQVGLAQPGRALTVAINGLPAGVSFDVVMSGKKLGSQTETGTAPQSGAVAVSLSLDDLVNLSKDGKPDEPVAVWVNKDCPDQKMRVMILEQGLQPNDDCGQGWVLIGTARIGKTFKLTIQWPGGLNSGGMGTGMKVGLGVGIPAAVTGVALGRGGSNATPVATTTPQAPAANNPGTTTNPGTPGTVVPPPTSNNPAPPATPRASTFAGRYTGTATATTNQCGFSGTATITVVIMVRDDGTATVDYAKTHTSAGVTFNFPNQRMTLSSMTLASLLAQTSQAIGTQMFNVTDDVRIDGSIMRITQTLRRADGACSVVYEILLNKA